MNINLRKKDVTKNFNFIISVGYCDLWYLLKGLDRMGYTCGVYGWNADIYKIDNVAIVTGYRPFGNIQSDYKLNKKYNEKARKIFEDNLLKWDVKTTKINKLLNKYIKETIEK